MYGFSVTRKEKVLINLLLLTGLVRWTRISWSCVGSQNLTLCATKYCELCWSAGGKSFSIFLFDKSLNVKKNGDTPTWGMKYINLASKICYNEQTNIHFNYNLFEIQASCPRVLKRQIAYDIRAETSPAHIMAFGTGLPQRMKHIPPKNNTEKMWHCVKIPADLKTMSCVWDDIQHLT